MEQDPNEVTSQGSCDFSEYDEFFDMQFMFGQLQSTQDSSDGLGDHQETEADSPDQPSKLKKCCCVRMYNQLKDGFTEQIRMNKLSVMIINHLKKS